MCYRHTYPHTIPSQVPNGAEATGYIPMYTSRLLCTLIVPEVQLVTMVHWG